MIQRAIEPTLLNALETFDCITLLGPRQSGKTTVVKKLFSDYHYINLENPEDRLIYAEDPKSLFAQYTKIILDEIQNVPTLLSFIQVYLDTRKYKIILTGSNQLDLRSNIAQSLAGRTAIFKLLPFTLSEIQQIYGSSQPNEWMFKGFYPVIYDRYQEPTLTYRSYYETYIQRDVRQVINISAMHLFDKFVRICAGRVGSILNFSTISNDLGVSVNTIKSWLSVLEYTFNCYLLQPFHGNINKRLLKSPKLYFYDVGLVCYLLGIEHPNQLDTHPLRGEIFENMVVNEFIKQRFNAGKDHNGFFYRDSHQVEIDYLRLQPEGIEAFEIKSAYTYTTDFKKSLELVSKIEAIQMISKNIIYNGESRMGPFGIQIHNFYDFFTN